MIRWRLVDGRDAWFDKLTMPYAGVGVKMGGGGERAAGASLDGMGDTPEDYP